MVGSGPCLCEMPLLTLLAPGGADPHPPFVYRVYSLLEQI